MRLLQFLQMLLILIMNKNVHLHPNLSYYYYQMCISKRQKSYIIINIIRLHKPISWFETISLNRTCRNKKCIFLVKLFILLRNINSLLSTFTLEQKSGFKFEINKDLTFIVKLIDLDWYEKILSWSFFGHIHSCVGIRQWSPPSPPVQVCARCVCAEGLLVQLLLCRWILGSVLWQEGRVCRLQGAALCARRVQGDGERRAGLPLPVWVQRAVLWNRWDTALQETCIIHDRKL